MEIAALILSILSFIFSCIIAVYQIKITIKLNNINLKSSIYEKIFDKYLITEIPNARGYIKFDNKNYLTGEDKLKDVLVNMLNDSLYFRYYDKNFYNSLKSELQSLEDFLVKNVGKQIEEISQLDFLNEIEVFLSKIYKMIEEKKIKG